MAISEICRICLSVNVRMFVLKKTGLQNLYKTLTNKFLTPQQIQQMEKHNSQVVALYLSSSEVTSHLLPLLEVHCSCPWAVVAIRCVMNEDEEPITVCVICHARLNRCRRLQQQAIESNAVLEQLLAGESMSVPKLHEARDEIQFTPIYLIDIRPVECGIENDSKDEIFSLESVKVEEDNFENENSKFEENAIHETEHYNYSEPSEKKIKSNSENLDFESPFIKSNPKVKEDNEPISKKGKHPTKSMKKKILKQITVNILTKKTSGASTKYIFQCDVCSKKFLTKDILAKHISYRHKTLKNSGTNVVRTQVEQTPAPQLTEIFNCDICEFKTSQKRCIMAHLKAHVAKQVYCCNNCDYKCTNKSNLIYHMKIHTGEKPFSCNACEYKFIKKSHLQRHMKIHTGEKPFSCNICEYKCIQKSNLQNHMKIHTGEKPFSCDNCEYKCITKSKLQNHMKIHTGVKLFSCNICEYKCIQKSNLQRHMKIHTGEKPFSCNICEYKCITKSNLQKHMKIHTGEKPFSCNICIYKCVTKNKLQTHMKTHTRKKPFQCNICEYKCITKSNLQTHIMKIHT